MWRGTIQSKLSRSQQVVHPRTAAGAQNRVGCRCICGGGGEGSEFPETIQNLNFNLKLGKRLGCLSASKNWGSDIDEVNDCLVGLKITRRLFVLSTIG